MLLEKLMWDKTTAFVLLNEILVAKIMNYMKTFPQIIMRPEARAIVDQLEQTYFENLQLLDLVTNKLEERDRSQTSSLSDEGEHAINLLDLLDQIYTVTDTDKK